MKIIADPSLQRILFCSAMLRKTEPLALSKYDDDHPEDEDRLILMGKSLSESILVVVHTFRSDDGAEIVRIISARKATTKEKQAYYNRCPK